MTNKIPARTRRALALTRAGLVAERLVQAFFPLWSVGFVVLGALLLGLPDAVASFEVVWAGLVLSVLGALWGLWSGIKRFKWPTESDALARLDQTLPGRPLTALTDDQAIGDADAASKAVWEAHLARMASAAEEARAPQPDLRVSRRDPFALRYVALLLLALGVLFGSFLRVTDLPGVGGDPLAVGPTWEGWIEPPAYTGKPPLYLADQTDQLLMVPQGSRVTIRLYGQVGALTVSETVSGRTGELPPASDAVQSFEITQDGELSIDGDGGRSWTIDSVIDFIPEVKYSTLFGGIEDEEELTNDLEQRFEVTDDYGVVSGTATIALDLDAVERRYGLTIDPDPRAPIDVPLPMTISGDRADFAETLIENFDQHPWAHLPVTMTFKVLDDLGQEGVSEEKSLKLPARRFFDPMAQAVIEQRQSLLWAKANADRVAQHLRAISHYPDDIFRSDTSYLRLRFALRRLETFANYGLTDEQQDEIAQALWDLAIQLEDGDLADAQERLARAQERLQEAIENGASDEEIAELMQELREAMQDYMRQLAETQPQQDQQQGEQQAQNGQEVTQDQLSQMLEELQRLMEEGRMAEAQQLLQQLQQMMENMQVTQGQQGQGQQSPGQEAMEGLAETLREQQGLSDDAFRDLQEQFNPNAQAGESGQNEGRSGGQGRGEQHTDQGQQGQGQGQEPGQESEGGGTQGQNQQPGQGGQQGGQSGGDLGQSLADRQQALRQELQRQRDGLPGAGTEGGEAAREALDRAGRAMDNAEDALRNDDLAQALDDQSEAIDALRDGMQELGEAMAQQQQQGGAQQGNQQGSAQPMTRDPFGRDPSGQGSVDSGEDLLQGEDVYRRAQELLDEIRRRASDQQRTDEEIDYLRRLLDRF